MLTDKIEVLNDDCMKVMAKYPDKFFDLAVVDPPYGINVGGVVGGVNRSVRVGGANLSHPKSIGDLTTRKSPIKVTSLN